MDELLTGPPPEAGRHLVIAGTAAAGAGGTLDLLAARLEAASVPLTFAERAARVGVLVRAGDQETALAAGMQAVAAAGDRAMHVTRTEVHAVPALAPVGGLVALAARGRW